MLCAILEGPRLEPVISKSIVAVLTSEVRAAALHLDSDNVERRAEVGTARPCINLDSAHIGPHCSKRYIPAPKTPTSTSPRDAAHEHDAQLRNAGATIGIADKPVQVRNPGGTGVQTVNVEDPGDEIGPEAEGSPHMGLWFHDPNGYRWELSVQGGR